MMTHCMRLLICVPLLLSRYEMSYTFFDARCAEISVWKREYFGFLRPMVLASAIFTSLCRTVAEAPIEQAKVMRQTGRPWQWSSLYRGLTAQTGRTTAMLILIFVPYDVRTARAHKRFQIAAALGAKHTSASVAALEHAYIVINKPPMQSDTPRGRWAR